MKTNITYSSELMQHYKHAEIVAPDTKFEALQTKQGHSLFFSIGTDDVFYVTREAIGSKVGYIKSDQSSAISRFHEGEKIKVKTFSVSQQTKTGAIVIVLAVSVKDTDFIYSATITKNNDEQWKEDIQWNAIPFDDKDHEFSKIVVTETYIHQTPRKQYIVVDILKDPKSTQGFVFRYFIDLQKKVTGSYWVAHDLSANLHASSITSCAGQKDPRIGGIYTLGTINKKQELIYTPFYNAYDLSVAPTATRLEFPKGASAIASVSTDQKTTHLFVAGGTHLSYFPSGKQQDGTAPVRLMEHPLFGSVETLYALFQKNKVVIWGLNRAQELFYTTCDSDKLGIPAAWTHPIILIEGVQELTPYINRVNQGNTFFAHVGENRLTKATQSPTTTVWSYEDILLPPLDKKDTESLKFNSYTTRIKVTDENNQPIFRDENKHHITLEIASSSRNSVYINNRYYLLDTTPIPIKVDHLGALTIVELVNNSLSATSYEIYGANGQKITIDPMQGPQEKLTSLNTLEKLNDAKIRYNDGSEKSLIHTSVSENDRKEIVRSIQQLTEVSDSLKKKPVTRRMAAKTRPINWAAIPTQQIQSFSFGVSSIQQRRSLQQSGVLLKPKLARGREVLDFSKAIEVAAGDVISFFENVAHDVSEFFIVNVQNAWHFIVNIGNELVRFIISTTQKVMSALEFVFNAIKTGIEDLLDFLSYLFDWEDLVRTKDVFKNLLVLTMHNSVDMVESLKGELAKLTGMLKTHIDEWAGIEKDTWQRIDYSSNVMSHANKGVDFTDAFSAPSMFFQQHFSDNIDQLEEGEQNLAAKTGLLGLIDVLYTALMNQGTVFSSAIERIDREILQKDPINMKLGDLLKKIAGIVFDAIINTAENFIDLIIDLFVLVARTAIEAIDEPIRFPIIHDILEDALGIKIRFSLLDIICMIGAVPAAIIYKAALKKAPFSKDDGFSQKIIDATSVADLRASFPDTPTPQRRMAQSLSRTEKETAFFIPINFSHDAREVIFIVGHMISGIVGVISSGFVFAQNATEFGVGPLEGPISVTGAVSAGATAITGFIAEPNPIQDPIWSAISSGAGGATLLAKIIFYGLGKSKEGFDDGGAAKATVGKVGAGVNSVIGIVSMATSVYHIVELSKAPKTTNRTLAVVIVTGSMCGYLSRMTEFAALVDPEPISKAVLGFLTGELVALNGLLELGAGIGNIVYLAETSS
ncbi:hypothetical protein GCM10011344_30610 [Dokdonia pacifica]|uniref:Uncharacterized protein n=1 Tax=Dokdonia pacifica TaxID=1627892 RepID=A0A239E9S0_9FLAO|nr:hypothetical protein [Dokdonia pacifica]GGG27672.1 hypothetical protein GCM10011344_30610 [Dokdonia pacifica]SNS41366.1 hypothetical protein SAMN06265376_11522 [Dokdonia pacifica]